MGRRWHALAAVGVACAAAAAAVAAGDRGFTFADAVAAPEEVGYMRKVVNFLWSGEASYHHVWPVILPLLQSTLSSVYDN